MRFLALSCVILASLSPLLAQAGREDRLQVPGCKYPCVIYLPVDYDKDRLWPVIFFMHGAGGHPTTWPWKTATEGKGYIIVGLSYGVIPEGGAKGIRADKSTRLAMVGFINKVRDLVDQKYGIDKKRIFLTGLSMGGWGVNFYGFLKDAAGLYRGYCIIAAGPRRGADLTVVKGLPVMILNGGNDPNLAAANAGKPALEKAGALVTQVVLPGEGHVPSTTSMASPLKKWLDRIEKEDRMGAPLAAIKWIKASLKGSPAGSVDKPEAALEFFKSQGFLANGEGKRPSLVFCYTRLKDKKGGWDKASRQSISMEEELFCFPKACCASAAARHFNCFRLNFSKVEDKGSRVFNKRSLPLLFLIDQDKSAIESLKKSIKDGPLGKAMNAYLTGEEKKETAERVVKIKPILKGIQKASSRVKKLRKELNKALSRKRSKAVEKAISKKSNEIKALEKKIGQWKEELLK